MITVTMEQIIDFNNSENIFAEANIPLKGAYKLNKIKKAIEKETEFYSEKFQEIIDKYAKKDKDGNLVFSDDQNQILINDGMVEECNKAIEDLQNLEVQIENYNFTIDDLGENLQCTPDELEPLMPFME